MEDVNLTLSFYDENGQRKHEQIHLDEQMMNRIVEMYGKHYAQQEHWYRFGNITGSLILHNFSFHDLFKFIEKIPEAKEFEEQVVQQNPVLKKYPRKKILRTLWIELYRYISCHHMRKVESLIKEYSSKVRRRSESRLEEYARDCKGEKVIFYTFNEDWFAIPFQVAKEVGIEDYHEEDLWRDDERLLDKIWKYKTDKNKEIGLAWAEECYLFSDYPE